MRTTKALLKIINLSLIYAYPGLIYAYPGLKFYDWEIYSAISKLISSLLQ